jgi:SAM-dependent methyltransferase
VAFIFYLLRLFNLAPVPLLDAQASVVGARALMEANNAGIFHFLAKTGEGKTAHEVSAHTGFAPDGTLLLLRALVSTGYLKEQGGRFRNSRWATHWIVNPKTSLTYMLRLQMFTYKRLEDLGENLKTGGPTANHHMKMDLEVPTKAQETYTRAMREAARMIIPSLLKRVSLPSGPLKLLDIGGAHGEYCRAFSRHYPGVRATSMDLGAPVATARRIMDEEGNAEQLELKVGNCLEDDLGSGWDVILLVNMVHLFDIAQNRDLFKRCHAALKPGGSLLAVDQFVGVSQLRDSIFAVVSLNFFNVGGKSYGADETIALLKEAGFARSELKPPSIRTPACLIQAYA